jgi:hypothetical protein
MNLFVDLDGGAKLNPSHREIEDNEEKHVPDRKTGCRRKEDGRDPRSLVRFPSAGARRTIDI